MRPTASRVLLHVAPVIALILLLAQTVRGQEGPPGPLGVPPPSTPDHVQVALGDPAQPGVFGPPTIYQTAGIASHVIVGQFTPDSILDLFVVATEPDDGGLSTSTAICHGQLFPGIGNGNLTLIPPTFPTFAAAARRSAT